MRKPTLESGDRVRVKRGNIDAGREAVVDYVFEGLAGGWYVQLRRPHGTCSSVWVASKLEKIKKTR